MIIFFKLTKTATKAIGETFNRRLKELSSRNNILRLYNLGHNSWPAYVKKLGQEEYDSAFKFSFVRNPWERMVSAYFYSGVQLMHHEDRVEQPEELACGFRSWLKSHHALSWVGKHYATAEQLLRGSGVNYIGRYEKFDESIRELVDLIEAHEGIRLPTEIPKMNTGRWRTEASRLHYSYFYGGDSTAINFVRNHSLWDIETFGYQFEVPE